MRASEPRPRPVNSIAEDLVPSAMDATTVADLRGWAGGGRGINLPFCFTAILFSTRSSSLQIFRLLTSPSHFEISLIQFQLISHVADRK